MAATLGKPGPVQSIDAGIVIRHITMLMKQHPLMFLAFLLGGLSGVGFGWFWWSYSDSAAKTAERRVSDSDAGEIESAIECLVFTPPITHIQARHGLIGPAPLEGIRTDLFQLLKNHKKSAAVHAVRLLEIGWGVEADIYAIEVLDQIESDAGLSAAKQRLAKLPAVNPSNDSERAITENVAIQFALEQSIANCSKYRSQSAN